MALGARPTQILLPLMRQGLRSAFIGLILGVGAVVYAQQWLAGMLYEVAAFDPMTFGAAISGVLMLLLAAVWWPARRAARHRPATGAAARVKRARTCAPSDRGGAPPRTPARSLYGGPGASRSAHAIRASMRELPSADSSSSTWSGTPRPRPMSSTRSTPPKIPGTAALRKAGGRVVGVRRKLP